MTRIDNALRILVSFFFAFLCLISAGFASQEEPAVITADDEASPVSVVYEYEISIVPPSGWYEESGDISITIRDVHGTGWDSAVLLFPDSSDTKSINGESTAITISENGSYTVRVTDPDGGIHEASTIIECFDRTAPSVTGGIRDKVLHCEASDSQSGVYGIFVDGSLYTTLVDGSLDLRLEDYSSAGKSLSISAIDNVGNRSAITTIENPYYSDSTPTPTPTPAPAATNSPVIIYTGTQNDGSSGSSKTTPSTTTTASNSAPTNGTTTNKSTPSPTATPAAPVSTPGSSKNEEITLEPGNGFTENGNGVTRDLLYDKHTNKQFVTIQTRNGQTFYLVIDYDKVNDEDEEQYQTYFLNPVDEVDLLALLDNDTLSALTASNEVTETTSDVCTCQDKCEIGHINTSCPVCRTDVSKCTGIAVTPVPEPTEAPEADSEQATENSKNSVGGILGVILILGLISGGVVYLLKNKKSKPQTSGSTDFDDYDFGVDDEDEGIPEDEEAPYVGQNNSP